MESPLNKNSPDFPRRRPSIHNTPNPKKRYRKKNKVESDEEDDPNTSEDQQEDESKISDHEQEEDEEFIEGEANINESTDNLKKTGSPTEGININYGMLIAIVVVGVVSFLINTSTIENRTDMESIMKKFPLQEKMFFQAFESGVNEVINFEKPSVFMLLYKSQSEEVLSELLENLSQFALCQISDCSNAVIELSNDELNSPEIVNDFGKIIERYKESLEQNGVMIVRNLENVESASAQVFHFICDEFSPFVKKSIIIFTVKVEELPEANDQFKFVNDFFKNKWGGSLKVSIFNALITRITNMILNVHS